MTTHYVDMTVVPDPGAEIPQLFGALFGRLHLALVQQRIDSIGVSFPGYSEVPRSLGATLRMHGEAEALAEFLQKDWLKGVRDHVRMTSIAEAPREAPHRTIRRRQFKTSVERLRKRRMDRKGETLEQATKAIPDTVERQPQLPYIHVRSHSTGQFFCLFITMDPPVAKATPGAFNSYGLAGTATIPWF